MSGPLLTPVPSFPTPQLPPRKVPPVLAELKAQKDSQETESEAAVFEEHEKLWSRMGQGFYYGKKAPSTPRPSLPLTKLAVRRFSSRGRQDTLSFLDVEKAAEIGRNACVTPTALVMALVYLERLGNKNPSYLGSMKPSDLFVLSLLAASKFVQDDGEELGIFNDEWAASAGLELRDLNRMELDFLSAIDWDLKVDQEEFQETLTKVEEDVGLAEGKDRGWFTYSELANILKLQPLWPVLYEHCLKVIVAANVAYTALIATLFTSSILGPQIFLLTKGLISSTTVGQPGGFQFCANVSIPCSGQLLTNDLRGRLDSPSHQGDEDLSSLLSDEEAVRGPMLNLDFEESLQYMLGNRSMAEIGFRSDIDYGVRWLRGKGPDHHLPVLEYSFLQELKRLVSSERTKDKDKEYCTGLAQQLSFPRQLMSQKLSDRRVRKCSISSALALNSGTSFPIHPKHIVHM